LLRLGIFPDFKGFNAVLLSADSDGIKALIDALSRPMAAPDEVVSVHEIARVSRKHQARLFLTATQPAPGIAASESYYWVVPENERPTVMELLEPLASAAKGHQFFDLVPAAATLLVSVAEYDTAWWERVDA
jgi:hypothetical protein